MKSLNTPPSAKDFQTLNRFNNMRGRVANCWNFDASKYTIFQDYGTSVSAKELDKELFTSINRGLKLTHPITKEVSYRAEGMHLGKKVGLILILNK